jgi:integrase
MVGTQGITRDVRRPWKIGRANSKKKPYLLRWVVAGRVVVKTFPTFALADSFRSELIQAMARAEAFDIATGLPASMQPARISESWLEFSAGYVADRWSSLAAKTRDSITDSLATAAIAMTDDEGAIDARAVRQAFLWAVLPANKGIEPPPELRDSLAWLRRHSLPVTALADPARARAVVHRLTMILDGTPAAGDTWRRRRRGVNTAVEYAVESGQLEENPLHRVKVTRVAAITEVDPRAVVTHAQARELLTAVSYVGSWDRARGRRLVAFFATMYYAGLRPAEATALRDTDCQLPDEGWGTLTLARSLPVTTKKWTDHGQRHDPRGAQAPQPRRHPRRADPALARAESARTYRAVRHRP